MTSRTHPALTDRPPVASCPATDLDPTGAGLVLHCALPAGHHSLEHYDRVLGRVWRHTDDQATAPRADAGRFLTGAAA